MHAYMYIFACAYTCTHAHTCIYTHALYIICAYTYYTFIYEYIPYNTHKYIIRIFSIVYLYVLCIIYIYILAITHKYVYIYNCLLNLQNKKYIDPQVSYIDSCTLCIGSVHTLPCLLSHL